MNDNDLFTKGMACELIEGSTGVMGAARCVVGDLIPLKTIKCPDRIEKRYNKFPLFGIDYGTYIICAYFSFCVNLYKQVVYVDFIGYSSCKNDIYEDCREYGLKVIPFDNFEEELEKFLVDEFIQGEKERFKDTEMEFDDGQARLFLKSEEIQPYKYLQDIKLVERKKFAFRPLSMFIRDRVRSNMKPIDILEEDYSDYGRITLDVFRSGTTDFVYMLYGDRLFLDCLMWAVPYKRYERFIEFTKSYQNIIIELE